VEWNREAALEQVAPEELQEQLEELCATARGWGLPTSPKARRSAASPATPIVFAAGRQWPPPAGAEDEAARAEAARRPLAAHVPSRQRGRLPAEPEPEPAPSTQRGWRPAEPGPEAEAAPAASDEFFEQIVSAQLWGPGGLKEEIRGQWLAEARAEQQSKHHTVVDKVKSFRSKWDRAECVSRVGKLLSEQVEAAERAYCSRRALIAACPGWGGQDFQDSLAALGTWHDAHAENSALQSFLRSFEWALDPLHPRHNRIGDWSGEHSLLCTIRRAMEFTKKRLLHEVLRGKMRDKKLDMGILREVANTLLSMVVGAGVETSAEARAILPPTREVLEFVLYLSRWWQDLHEEPRFREQTLRCFVRSFELLSLAGQLKRDEVADTGPLPTYRLSLRHQALDEFRKWAEARAEEISEFHGSVAVVLSAGLLLEVVVVAL